MSAPRRVFATTQVPHEGLVFESGDELQLHIAPEHLETLIEIGHASLEKPANVKVAYATVALDWNPHLAGFHFEPDDRIDGVMPAPLVAQIVARGDGVYEQSKPEPKAKAKKSKTAESELDTAPPAAS